MLHCFAVVPPGVEAVAESEIRALGGNPAATEKGGVTFTATWDALFRIILRASSLTGVRLRLARFRARHQGALAWQLRQLDLTPWLGEQRCMRIRVSSRRSRMTHSEHIAQTVAEALQCKRQTDAAQCLYVRIDGQKCTLSLDVTGERLDRRGYRLESGKAPLRETLAAALLRWSGWDAASPLYAPMCGAGTFAIEAALLASRRPVNLQHNFPCVDWPCLPHKRWQRARQKASAMKAPDVLPAIMASDQHPGAVAMTMRNAERAGVAAMISVAQMDFRDGRADAGDGMIICNPPFGDRIARHGYRLYRDLGQWHRQYFPRSQLLTLCPDITAVQALEAPVRRQCEIISGGKRLFAVMLSP